MSVVMKPGAITLQVMLRRASSLATRLAAPDDAGLEAA